MHHKRLNWRSGEWSCKKTLVSLLSETSTVLTPRDQRYDEWRDIWRDDDGTEDKKFEAYAKSSPESAKRVLRQLALLSQALFDVHQLEDEYGFRQTERTNRVRTLLLTNNSSSPLTSS